jgi:hypothetical protein
MTKSHLVGGPLAGTRLLELARKIGPWWYVWLALALLFAWPLWSVTVIPLNDLPNHLARITALHHLNDPAWNLSPYYERSLGAVPYAGHFLVVHWLAYLFRSVPRANLFYMTAYVMTAPLAGLVFARATHRSPWLAFLLLPLAIGFFFQWGFVSFCVAVMLMLPAMAALYGLLDEPAQHRGKRAAAVFALTCALYFCHVLPWAAFGAYTAVLVIVELAHKRVRPALWATAATLPTVGLFALGLLRARSIGYVKDGAAMVLESDPVTRVLRRAANSLDLFAPTSIDEWVQLLLVAALFWLVISDGGQSDEPLRKRLRIPLAIGLFAFGFFSTPFSIKQPINWWMVNLRFMMPICAVAIFLPRGPIRGVRAGVLGVAIAIACVLPWLTARQYKKFEARTSAIVHLLRRVPLGSNTLLLHAPAASATGRRTFFDPDLSPEISITRELYNYPMVYRGGFSPYLYDDGFPVKRKASLPHPRVESAANEFTSADDTRFNADTMLPTWDYILVRRGNDAMPPDGVVLEAEEGEWQLYRSLRRNR